MSRLRNRLAAAVAVGASAALVLTSGSGAVAKETSNKLPERLANAVTVKEINRHLIAFQRVADRFGGTRVASSPGFDASVDYIATKLENVGYEVTRQEFPFVYDETLAESLSVGGDDVEIFRMSYSPSTPEGGVSGPLAAVDGFGCEPDDFDDVDVHGKIVVISRGVCAFADKQANAGAAGAIAAVIYNNTEGPLNGTLGDPDVGVVATGGVTQEAGEALVALDGEDATIEIRGLTEDRTTFNVFAQTRTGARDNVVMAGAHLDSVAAGPGINDNGSGSAALLETALQLGAKPKVHNAVRFAWWGAEELGLVGSRYYVENLSFDEQLDISMYLNFDMIASPNAGYFVYDGDDSDGIGAGPGPEGSGQIEGAFVERIESQGTPTEGTDFTGRSDYGPFIEVGIPAGGLFTGAEVLMTEEQAQKWGGQAGVAYDPCYHQECDNLSNINREALAVNSDAMAYVIGSYALSTEDVNGVAPGKKKPKKEAAIERTTERVFISHDHTNQHGHDSDHAECSRVSM